MCVVRHAVALAGLTFGAIACGGAPEDHSSADTTRLVADTTLVDAASAPDGARSFPSAGVAIHESGNRWCVALPADSLSPRPVITIVFPDSASRMLTLTARAARRATACDTAFPQLELAEDAVYDLMVLDSSGTGDAASVAIAVVSNARWSRGADGVARADLDGDGIPEEAKVCRALEGEYFTLWRRPAADSAAKAVWGRYFDWGAFVDENCAPGEGAEALSWLPAPDEVERAGAVARG